jgi:uncharacterized protein (TIGR02147 family)
MLSLYANVYEFSDFREFLAAYQAARQAQDKTFTRSRFCREIGLPNSRSFFNDIVKGSKPLSKVFLERFVKATGMDAQEGQYFRTLAQFNQATQAQEREALFDQLVSLNQTPKRFVTAEQYEFYRRWQHTALFALLDVIDFKDDFGALAKRVLPRISVPQARASIALMKKLQLIREDSRGYWKPVAKTLDAGGYLQNELIKQYQLQCLELSKEAMLLDTELSRNFSTVTLSVSRSGQEQIERKLQKFKSEVRAIAHRETEPADRVLQLNVQLFPQSIPEESP